MSLAVVKSRALVGMDAPPVQVEVHLAPGLPAFNLVGLADTEVREARERVRAALIESGFDFPHNRRITVSLAPADLPKESGRFDLPIALGILVASGLIDQKRLEGWEFAGELSLAGGLKPVRGALMLALAASQDASTKGLVLPRATAEQAARVPALDVRAADSLGEVVAALTMEVVGLDRPPPSRVLDRTPSSAEPDLRDVRGQSAAKRALTIAAAGGHGLLLVGPPGTGKSMLARRLRALLPPLSDAAALEVAALQGLGNALAPDAASLRPWRSPHHSASAVALVGGGSPPRPGEISLAHGGLLFLDELPEFPRSALEALREPLETGRITISRAARQATFPARFALVAAMNPCPCGWLGAFAATGRQCRCSTETVLRYQSKLSGPLLDRMDLIVEVPAVAPDALLQAPHGPSSADVALVVAQAHERAMARQGVPNAQLTQEGLDAHLALRPEARAYLLKAGERLGWSGRALHRVVKVARTIADLEACLDLEVAHVAEAVQLRRGLPAP